MVDLWGGVLGFLTRSDQLLDFSHHQHGMIPQGLGYAGKLLFLSLIDVEQFTKVIYLALDKSISVSWHFQAWVNLSKHSVNDIIKRLLSFQRTKLKQGLTVHKFIELLLVSINGWLLVKHPLGIPFLFV